MLQAVACLVLCKEGLADASLPGTIGVTAGVVLALVVAGASTCLACTPGTYGNSSGVCSGPALCVSAGFVFARMANVVVERAPVFELLGQ